MTTVVGVRFKKAGKVYYFDPGELAVKKNDFVILETARGVELGEVVVGPKQIHETEVVAPLKEVIRVATEEDLKVNEENKQKEEKAFSICLDKIEDHKLEMKLVDVEYTFDNNKIIFYFTAEGRVDFRELVKDLAGVFRTRIELRQIGVRDEAKMIGGIGPCGVSLCCATWLGDFDPVSIKMAKDQNLSLNPTKISGVCGRLFCCLKYEHEVYRELLKKLPHVGEMVKTPKGRGPVISTNTIMEKVKVKVTNDEDGTEEMKVFHREEVEKLGAYLKREKQDTKNIEEESLKKEDKNHKKEDKEHKKEPTHRKEEEVKKEVKKEKPVKSEEEPKKTPSSPKEQPKKKRPPYRGKKRKNKPPQRKSQEGAPKGASKE